MAADAYLLHQKKLMAVQRDSIIPGFAHTVGYYNNLDRYLHVYNLEVLQAVSYITQASLRRT